MSTFFLKYPQMHTLLLLPYPNIEEKQFSSSPPPIPDSSSTSLARFHANWRLFFLSPSQSPSLNAHFCLLNLNRTEWALQPIFSPTTLPKFLLCRYVQRARGQTKKKLAIIRLYSTVLCDANLEKQGGFSRFLFWKLRWVCSTMHTVPTTVQYTGHVCGLLVGNISQPMVRGATSPNYEAKERTWLLLIRSTGKVIVSLFKRNCLKNEDNYTLLMYR